MQKPRPRAAQPAQLHRLYLPAARPASATTKHPLHEFDHAVDPKTLQGNAACHIANDNSYTRLESHPGNSNNFDPDTKAYLASAVAREELLLYLPDLRHQRASFCFLGGEI